MLDLEIWNNRPTKIYIMYMYYQRKYILCTCIINENIYDVLPMGRYSMYTLLQYTPEIFIYNTNALS